MKSFLYAALLAAAALPVSAGEAAQQCSPAINNLCPVCDGSNITDAAGVEYAVSCGYVIRAESEDHVDGWTNTAICMEACDGADACFGINFSNNGSCSMAKSSLKGMNRSPGFTNLIRQPKSTAPASPTSRVSITATLGSSGTHTVASITTTSTAAFPSQSSTDECDLELTNLCPQCNEREVTGKDNRVYRILCNNELSSSNGTFSVQEWTSPDGCLAECADFPLCKGASYYDDRNCELAKGDNVHPTPEDGYTAFLPVASSAPTTSLTEHPTTTTTKANMTSSTVSVSSTSLSPIATGCSPTAPSCPACNDMPYVDQLNNSYTVRCDMAPVCDSLAEWQKGGDPLEQCVQGCDQDVTCLAALWYPSSHACNLCQQGMDERPGKNLSYIVLVADVDGDNDTTTTSSGLGTYAATRTTPTVLSQTSGSITDFPAPFTTATTDASINTGVGPVGPVVWTPSLRGATLNSTSTTRSISIIHQTTSAPHATVTNIGAVSCPGSNGDVYIEPDNGNYFAVACGSMFSAAHSRFLFASDFAACAAYCTGQCDGVQFGYSTSCGLYTDIADVLPGAGWTAAAIITVPTPLSTISTLATSTNTPPAYSIAKPTLQMTKNSSG